MSDIHRAEKAAWAAVELGRSLFGTPSRQNDKIAEWRLKGGLVVNIHRYGKTLVNVLAAGGPVRADGEIDLESGHSSPGRGPTNSNHSAEIKQGPTWATQARLDQLPQLERFLKDLVDDAGAPAAEKSTDNLSPIPSQPHVRTAELMTPRNIILYGPPGTGKTYETAALALELCGEPQLTERNAVMAAYAKLVADERIAFVTFHQSYGYEQFVEGLQPKTGGGDADAEDEGPGFRLEPEAGVLKRLADKVIFPRKSGRG